jgi:hypothetical protein
MAKKVVRGVMIIQKNADARTHPRPPAWTRRFKRANREQTIHSLLLNAISKRFAYRERRESGNGGPRSPGKRWTGDTVVAWRVPGKRFCGPAVD